MHDCSTQDSRLQCPPARKISREDIVISPLMLCLPPTLVGGQRPRTLFLEPASAGLLEEFKSPAEAGSTAICRSSNHQIKLVANRNICLCVSRFTRNLANRWAILNRSPGARRKESRTTNYESRTTPSDRSERRNSSITRQVTNTEQFACADCARGQKRR